MAITRMIKKAMGKNNFSFSGLYAFLIPIFKHSRCQNYEFIALKNAWHHHILQKPFHIVHF